MAEGSARPGFGVLRLGGRWLVQKPDSPVWVALRFLNEPSSCRLPSEIIQ